MAVKTPKRGEGRLVARFEVDLASLGARGFRMPM
jgi:hypothetical protein